MKSLRAAVVLLLTVMFAVPADAAKDGRIRKFDTRASADAWAAIEGDMAYAFDTNTLYRRKGAAWVAVGGEVSPEFTIAFNEGASKGLQLMQSDYTAFDSTAATMNFVVYGGHTLGAMMVVDAGNTLPAADADGLDITAGNVTDNDHVSYWSGTPGTSGRPFVVGTDAPFKACFTVKHADVSGSDAFYCGFRTPDPATVAIASYTDYCSVGYASGNVGTHDKANGADDCGTDTVADAATTTLCTLVGAAGACTYKVNGAAPSSPGVDSLGDGVLVVPFCQLLHDTDGAEDQLLTSWSVSYQ